MRNPDLEIRRSYDHLDGWVQDCSRSFANAMELLQSCTKPSILSSQCDFLYCKDIFKLNQGPECDALMLSSTSCISTLPRSMGKCDTCQDQGFASMFKEFYFCDMYIYVQILYNTSKLHNYCTELSQLYWMSWISELALDLAWKKGPQPLERRGWICVVAAWWAHCLQLKWTKNAKCSNICWRFTSHIFLIKNKLGTIDTTTNKLFGFVIGSIIIVLSTHPSKIIITAHLELSCPLAVHKPSHCLLRLVSFSHLDCEGLRGLAKFLSIIPAVNNTRLVSVVVCTPWFGRKHTSEWWGNLSTFYIPFYCPVFMIP